MWVCWVVFAAMAVIAATTMKRGAGPERELFELFTLIHFILPNLVCGFTRAWMFHIENPWLMLVPYLIGLFFCFSTGAYGITALPQYFGLFQVMCATFFLAFVPLFVSVGAGK